MFFHNILICILIDSELSKMYDFEGKDSNNLKSFQIHIFAFQNILHLFLRYGRGEFNTILNFSIYSESVRITRNFMKKVPSPTCVHKG